MSTTVHATWNDWQSRPQSSVEILDPAPVAALSALLVTGTPAPGIGQVLPPLWHWVALPRWPASSEIGLDGHPRRGTFLPPIDLPRRMFAGGRVQWFGDLQVGAKVFRESAVTSVVQKQGRSGDLVVVQVTTRLRSQEGGDLLLEEQQDLVYREADSPRPARVMPEADEASSITPVGAPLVREDRSWRFMTDPTLLMRFSAATANPHRIHYDWPYATRVEGYPGLVVQGPLSTIALAEVLRLSQHARITSLRHRNSAPLFCGTSARIDVDLSAPGTAEVHLNDDGGTRIASMSVNLDLDSVTHPPDGSQA
jgi:3-methylfumaryl-CoA hydratase